MYLYFKEEFLFRKGLCLVLMLAFSLPCLLGQALSPDRKEEIKNQCERNLTKTLLVWKDGEIIFEYGKSDQVYNIFSMRKSLTSLLIGIYVDKGIIDVNKTLDDLQIDDLKGLSAQEKEAKIIDLLKAKSGVYHQAAFETPGMRKNRPARETFKAGEHWFYNNWDFNTLITILEKASQKSIFKSFDELVANPLELQDFDIKKQQYILEDTVSIHQATLWKLSARDFLKIGQLMLNKGEFNGQRIVSEDWVKKSTQSYSNLGILGGYGYCWWVADHDMHLPFVNLPEGTYSARGTGEQNLVVIPKWNTIVMHMTEVNSPDDPMMKVTNFGRLMRTIFDQ